MFAFNLAFNLEQFLNCPNAKSSISTNIQIRKLGGEKIFKVVETNNIIHFDSILPFNLTIIKDSNV